MTNLIDLGQQLNDDNSVPNISEIFAEVIFAARVRQGLTQTQLSNLAGVSTKTIHRIEGGSGGITDTTYQKVFNVLDVNFNEVVTAYKKKPKKELVLERA